MGTVILSRVAPSGGARVTLNSSNGLIAAVPASVIVASGRTSATFTVTTNRVKTTTSVEISGVSGGLTKRDSLTVKAAETITIPRAEYNRSRSRLRVDATSTEPTAKLSVYVTATGAFIGNLTSSAGGNFSGVFSWPTNPKNVTVRSSGGGSAASDVTLSQVRD